MKASVLFLSILGLAITGCSRTYIEKPVASQPTREIIVEKQVPQREIIVAEKPVLMARSCAIGSTVYSHGSSSCQSGYQFRCDDGRWENRGALC
jgi:hypothetical protein